MRGNRLDAVGPVWYSLRAAFAGSIGAAALCMRRTIAYALAALGSALVLACGSDPEGPVMERFLDDGSYGVKAGETRRAVIPVTGATVSVPQGVGTSRLLVLGRLRGLEYRVLLLKFDFTRSAADSAKTVASARLRLPVQAVSPENAAVRVSFHELLEGFADADSIVAVPPYGASPIPDSLGVTVHELGLGEVEFGLDTAAVNAWFSGRRPLPGIAVVWAAPPDTNSTVEVNARERGTDPCAIRVAYAGGTTGSFGAAADYTVVTFAEPGLSVVGGLARRVHFTFDLAGIPERAAVHASFLVLKSRGDLGVGATAGDLGLGLSYLFSYYLYAPESADTLSAAFRSGTGVDQGTLDPVVSTVVRMPLRGYVPDVLKGSRANRGLVLQSNLEAGRIQRAAFVVSGEDAPYIEIYYTLPADFGGAP